MELFLGVLRWSNNLADLFGPASALRIRLTEGGLSFGTRVLLHYSLKFPRFFLAWGLILDRARDDITLLAKFYLIFIGYHKDS